MTKAAVLLGGVKFWSDHNAIPGMLTRPLAASEQVGKGQFVTVNSSTGYAILNDGITPNQIAAGLGDVSELSDTSANDAGAYTRLSQRFASGHANGATTDAIADTDYAVPFWIGDENTPGKLSHTGSDATLKNRSMGGLAFGLDKAQNNSPVIWVSPVAWCIARGVHLANKFVVARDKFTLTGNTTRAEAVMARNGATHGRVAEVRIMSPTGFTSHDTNFWTITVSKRTSTTPGTAVVVATATLKTTGGGGIGDLTAYKYLDVTLSGTSAALDLLEDDVLTVTCGAESTAAGMTDFTVEVIQKVQ